MKILAIGDFHGKFSSEFQKRVKRIVEQENVELVLALGDYTGLPDWRPIILKQLKAGKKGEEIPSAEDILGEKNFKKLIKKDFKKGLDVLRALNKLGKPVLLIFGNGDWYKFFANNIGKCYEPYVKKMKNLKNINYSKAKVKGTNFVGFGGYMDIDSFFNKKEWKDESDETINKRIKRRKQAKKLLFSNLRKAKGEKILVLHYTPKGAFDIINGKTNPLHGKSAGVSIFNDAIKKFKPKLVFCGHMHEYQGKKKLEKSLIVNPGDAQRGRFAVADTQSLNVRFYR